MKTFIQGFACRSKSSDSICLSTGSKPPEKDFEGKKTGWYWHIPGWFHTTTARKFKKAYGLSVEPGTHVPIKIAIQKGETK